MFRIVGLAVLLAVSVYSTSFQDVGIAEHNRLRAKHGGPNVTLDSGLQGLAQQWVDYLVTKNRFERPANIGYGVNIFRKYISTGPLNITQGVKEAITDWYGAIQYYNFSDPGNQNNRYRAHEFTQLVWKASTKVGIGAAVYKDPITGFTNEIVMAYYNPPDAFFSDASTYKTNVVPPK